MAINRTVRWVLFLGAFLGLAVYALLRPGPSGPRVTLTGPQSALEVTVDDLASLPHVERAGSYQNLYGNWAGHGVYRGVPLLLLGQRHFPDVPLGTVTVVGADGYQVDFSRPRLQDPDYPVVLAYARDGRRPPAWEDGPRIAVLPADGGVSNAEYGAESAGAFWVKNVVEIEFHPHGGD
ncbi:MAG: hypothetical protein ACP5G2_05175 [Candidatus Bipolaricaulaceae bacterium]